MPTHLEKFSKWLDLQEYSEDTKETYLRYVSKIPNINQIPYIPSQQSIEKTYLQYQHAVCRACLNTYVTEFLKMPALAISAPRGRRKVTKPVYLRKEEIEQLAKAANPELELMILIGFEGGLRASEILSLTPKSFDFKYLKIRGVGKGKKGFVVEMKRSTSEKIVCYIKSNKIKKEDPLFKMNRKQFWYQLKKLGKEILDKDVHPHNLRHSTGFYLRKMGMDLRDIQEYLRHSQIQTVVHYTPQEEGELQKKWRQIYE